VALHYAARNGSADIIHALVAAAGDGGPTQFPNTLDTK
jgi:hypothetical protein